jgi:transcriptional regulator with XRE-family HTH domain
MTQKIPFPQLREQAIALRRAGKSRREIKELLDITSNETLNESLKGEPPQPWTRRPNAKDEFRAKARELRQQGLDYEEIADELDVSKSSVSLWVRDLPRPERLSYEECRQRAAEGVRRYWAAEGPLREAEREAVRVAAADEIGELSDREIIIAGAITYWCEGSKNKPHRRQDRVDFINSDPTLIKFFLRFLDVAGIASEQLIFRVYIHEAADVEAAQRFWLDLTRAQPDQFRHPVLKRHNPKTVRKNTGNDYHGCLRINARRSTVLYRTIEGWADAVMVPREPREAAMTPTDRQVCPADHQGGAEISEASV